MSKEQFDKKIDFLARKAAENYSLPFTEEAWDKMEELLHKEEKKKRPAVWWWSATAILLLAGIGYFLLNHQNNKNSFDSLSENKTIEQLDNNNNQKNNPIDSNRFESNDKLAKKDTKENNNNKLQNTINESSAIIKTNSTKAISNSNSETNTKQKTSYKSITSLNKTNSRRIKSNNKMVASDADSRNVAIEETLLDNYLRRKLANNEFYTKSMALQNDLKLIKDNLPQASNIFTTDNSKNTALKKQSSSFINKLEIGLLAAADISSVDFKKADKISTNLGVLLSYPISKRISVSGGFAISNKIYSADSNNYKNPSAPNSHYLITGIDAKCLVYEIPINFQYLLRDNKKSSWLGIAGLSSYLMKKENYDYYYSYYGNPKKLTYKVNNENNHYFSILNLAIAYRKKINNQFSYQIMPFSKIPLAGIGKGKVNLYTLGLAATFNYSIGKK